MAQKRTWGKPEPRRLDSTHHQTVNILHRDEARFTGNYSPTSSDGHYGPGIPIIQENFRFICDIPEKNPTKQRHEHAPESLRAQIYSLFSEAQGTGKISAQSFPVFGPRFKDPRVRPTSPSPYHIDDSMSPLHEHVFKHTEDD